MSPRMQLRRLMSDVDQAADNADHALQTLRSRGVVGVLPERDPAVTPLRSGLFLASMLMAAKVLFSQD
ncbi:hypothetical protein [Stappia sp. ES.058]|uniref:hypothetical protein n=1 Tax=Stappia sp. ES.058 TaxID=1881061 RepID=UPI0012FD224B|nr:hypothetical protein [Stappia sp. ES.058]